MDLATARDLSLIWLAFLGIILTLVPAAAFYFSIRGMNVGTKWLRKIGLPEAQKYTRLMADKTNEYTAKVTDPITEVETAVTQAKSTVSSVPTVLRRRRQRSDHAN
ncbi:MAG: hypothetical protein GY759_03155 [Chloroflexi bacterium]|nr:hypothetical protein [Chloroflexota bacterium]